ncbi:MAG: hypothetical protein O2890_14800 [Cyanobacteria bacterium]|nr:hypothetical protein [Cyanobacteriota bacterium]MDA0867639.1 hypothetical protein [Cyanobacteriota bacterium]
MTPCKYLQQLIELELRIEQLQAERDDCINALRQRLNANRQSSLWDPAVSVTHQEHRYTALLGHDLHIGRELIKDQ